MMYERIRDITEDSQVPSIELIRDPPSKYHATLEFGDDLLHVNGYRTECVSDLFCIRSFALTKGISQALQLIKDNITCPSESFPRRLYDTLAFPNITKKEAADMERECLRWELADEIPDESCLYHTSESKHIRSESTIAYAIIANKIVQKMDDSYMKQECYDYFYTQVKLMMAECNLMNLIYKLKEHDKIMILDDILKNETLINALRVAHVT